MGLLFGFGAFFLLQFLFGFNVFESSQMPTWRGGNKQECYGNSASTVIISETVQMQSSESGADAKSPTE